MSMHKMENELILMQSIQNTTDKNIKSMIMTFILAIVLSSISFAMLFMAPLWSISYIDESPSPLSLFFLTNDRTDNPWPLPERKVFFDYKRFRNYLNSNNTNDANFNAYAPHADAGPPPRYFDNRLSHMPIDKKPEQPARIIYRVEPVFHEIEKKKAEQGSMIIVEVTITDKGSVASAIIIRGAYPLWNKAALDAVRQWRFEPARNNNESVSSTLILLFLLDLR